MGASANNRKGQGHAGAAQETVESRRAGASGRTASGVAVAASAASTGKPASRSRADRKGGRPASDLASRKAGKPASDLEGFILAERCLRSNDMVATQRNNNVVVIGGSGSGKSRSVIMPNIMQLNCSMVVCDPKGRLHRQLAGLCAAAGYEVGTLNLVEPETSIGYNPLRYVHTDEDVASMAHLIVESALAGDPHVGASTRAQAEALLKCALFYCRDNNGDAPFVMREVIGLLSKMSLDPDGDGCESFKRYAGGQMAVSGSSNKFDEVMEELRRGYRIVEGERMPRRDPEPDCPAVRMWLALRGGKCVSPELESTARMLNAHLSRLDAAGLLGILDGEGAIDLRTIGEKKTALFVVVSDTDRSNDLLATLFFGQAFKELFERADVEHAGNQGRLPVPVHFIFDDFASQTRIPGFATVIADARSRNIWITIACQSIAQLSERYGRVKDTIMACCDLALCLGTNDLFTAREFCERADVPLQRVLNLKPGEVLIVGRNVEPCIKPTYRLESHPNYSYAESVGGGKAPRGKGENREREL